MPKFKKYHQAVKELEEWIGQEQSQYMHTSDPQKQQFFLLRAKFYVQKLHLPLRLRDLNFIHIAGSAGKGSTATMIANILYSSGKSVGLYTSPHVTTSIERIWANNQLISPGEFAVQVKRALKIAKIIKKTWPNLTPSYDEIFFGMALNYFCAQKCHWIVLETGCGGRFDKTNIIPIKKIAVITNINRDHTDILGPTLDKIAWHKAGIINKGCKVLSSHQPPLVRSVLIKEAKKIGVSIEFIQPKHFIYFPTLTGLHQQKNAALAARAAQIQKINEESIIEGIRNTKMPARVEFMQDNPLVILDGAHSKVKMAALAKILATFKPKRKIHVIFSAKESKNLKELIFPLAPHASEVTVTSFRLISFGSHNTNKTFKLWENLNPKIKIRITENPLQALKTALKEASLGEIIVITGSLYLAGILRTHWITEHKILQNRSCF